MTARYACNKRVASGDARCFGLSSAPFLLKGYAMLEATLTQLEQLINELLQQNSAQNENVSRLEQELQRVKEENDTLQLAAMEMEEQQNEILTRLQTLVQRGGTTQKAE